MDLIPPTIPLDTPSPGEVCLFEQLRGARTDPALDGWTVLHSLDVANHRRQLQGEIDFLFLVPGLGCLALEVKGTSHLPRAGGLWFYGGDIEGDARGPFRQAAEAMHSIRGRLVQHRPHLAGVLFWSGVCFPFVPFDDSSEEWHSWQIIDQRKLERRSITDCARRVLEQARDRVVDLGCLWLDRAAGEPTAAQCAEIVKALRPDFEYFESPKARATRTEEEIRYYTQQQYEALDHMRRTTRVVFDGPAGTGKTLLALEQARRSASLGRRVLLLCFNRPLAEWLRDQIASLPGVAVATVHEHMTQLAGERPKGTALDRAYWDSELPAVALETLLESPDGHVFDELIIDEAQDVVRECFLDVLDLSLAGGIAQGTWRMFGDFTWQTIYDDTVSLDGFCSTRGGGCSVFALDENCRNTPRVAALACSCGCVEPGYRKILRPDDGVEPEIRFHSDAERQSAQLVEVLEELRSEGFTGPQVAVLSTRKDGHAAAAGLIKEPWRGRIEWLVDDQTHTSRIDFRSGKTRCSSIYRFKGLEARAVVLTDVERLASPHDRSLLYIGATRATHRLVVLAHERLRAQLTF